MSHTTPRKSVRRKNADLHGSAPDKSEVALIIVDVINDLDFPEAKQLARFIPKLVVTQAFAVVESECAGHRSSANAVCFARSFAALRMTNRSRVRSSPAADESTSFFAEHCGFRAFARSFSASAATNLSPQPCPER
jgi:hypothetical protein